MAGVLWIIGVYLPLGVGLTILLSQTPYGGNGWIVTTLLWPLFVYGILFGG